MTKKDKKVTFVFQRARKSRIKEDDSSVPYLDNGYYYYTRYEKDKQYPITTIIDGNKTVNPSLAFNAVVAIVSDRIAIKRINQFFMNIPLC